MRVDIVAAAALLRDGELVAFPTETVYGLGADASRPDAVMKIFALKGRPADHPLIVHVEHPEDLRHFTASVPAAAQTLAGRFWPGPLTMILPKASRVPAEVTGGQDTVGVRVPSHPKARALLAEFNRVCGARQGIAAPSANRFGHVSPTSAEHVRTEFGPELAVLDGGECDVGLESTIVDFSRGDGVLLRPGGIERRDIEAALGTRLRERDAAAPRASGTLAAHYAPRTKLVLVTAAELENELRHADSYAVLAFARPYRGAAASHWITAPPEASEYAHDLYANLRRLDASGARCIFVEAPPTAPDWEAVNDRLARAAAGTSAMDDEP